MEEETRQEEAQEEPRAASAGENEAKKPIDKMTAKELREIAKEIPGVEGVHAMKKDELLAVVKEFKGIKDEGAAEKKKKKTKKPLPSARDLKKRLRVLRQEKEAARKEKDQKKVDVLRRRINRMKKLTRKAAQG